MTQPATVTAGLITVTAGLITGTAGLITGTAGLITGTVWLITKTAEVENVNGIDLRCGDALEELKTLPDGSADLVLTDPPYNIGVTETRAGSKTVAAWDKIENYTDWCIDWLNECSRVLKPNGVLYF